MFDEKKINNKCKYIKLGENIFNIYIYYSAINDTKLIVVVNKKMSLKIGVKKQWISKGF